MINDIIGKEQGVIRERQYIEERNVRIRITTLENDHTIEVGIRALISVYHVVRDDHDIAWIEQYAVIRLIAVGIAALVLQVIARAGEVAHIAVPQRPFAVGQCALRMYRTGWSGDLVIIGGCTGEIHRNGRTAAQCNRRGRHYTQVVAMAHRHIVITCCCTCKNYRRNTIRCFHHIAVALDKGRLTRQNSRWAYGAPQFEQYPVNNGIGARNIEHTGTNSFRSRVIEISVLRSAVRLTVRDKPCHTQIVFQQIHTFIVGSSEEYFDGCQRVTRIDGYRGCRQRHTSGSTAGEGEGDCP